MYSNSNIYLGGASQQRAGQPQYGTAPGTPFNSMPTPQQPPQQPSPFAPHPTGYGQPLQQMQPQYTGFPMQAQPSGLPPPQQQPSGFSMQPTGYQQSQPTGFHTQPTGLQQPQPTGYQMPQATGYQSGFSQAPNQLGLMSQYTGIPGQQQARSPQPPTVPQIPTSYQQQAPNNFSTSQTTLPPPPAKAQKAQPTGFQAMAASFHIGGTTKPAAAKGVVNRIPNIRLSFITAPDQGKFETLFKSAVGPNSAVMSGEQARDLLIRSKLDGDALSHIW